ncbi:hypothetical protein BD779DRAFT_1519905 [Infundibulicybe gibba]|nr:hypothetical protein BD779DRAFT_1519905 [Infundibulicybe gibba]
MACDEALKRSLSCFISLYLISQSCAERWEASNDIFMTLMIETGSRPRGTGAAVTGDRVPSDFVLGLTFDWEKSVLGGLAVVFSLANWSWRSRICCWYS